MIRVADYLVKRLVEYGVKDVFMITGGGAMHLNDAVGSCPELNYICNHHEQASAIGAEGYSRVSGEIGVCVVTSGPGGTNTLTGLIGQWLDSVPGLYISGQVKRETTIDSCRELGLRQLGDQEINIVDMVRPVTKFAASIADPKSCRFLLEKALHLATHGRPGPVWLDVPLDVQGALVDEESLEGFSPEPECAGGEAELPALVAQVLERLAGAKRPVIVAGHGIRLSGGAEEFLRLAELIGVPVLSTFSGMDLVPGDHPLYVGRIGTIGNRAGNFALQNADVVLSIGSRNNIRQVSYGWQTFARAAYKVVVDIDPAELAKPTVRPDLAIRADAKGFCLEMLRQVAGTRFPDFGTWRDWCAERRRRYPAVLPEQQSATGLVNPYHFIQVLTEQLPEDAIVVAGNGTACVVLFQAAKVKKGQRVFWNSGCASMGYDLPAAIGACIAAGGKQVICLAGDGSLQMNIQELQTVAHYRLPIKLFVLNNDGYISIRQTQSAFFNGRFAGCDARSGVSFPDPAKIATAYGLCSAVIDRNEAVAESLSRVLAMPGPVVCDVRLLPDYAFEPKLSSEKKPDGRIVSKPLEDMYPFLDRDEFAQNMLIDEWKSE
ncbi:thiamine pyrophosphate-binding protein [Geomonas terrae]|uniref:Thiamine pyrophosphate-binding protein n=1 Tax=Geomonas terrae TaxID=2562681 RepID=A0A4S1C9U1_9BACT|nr:thiamine pyrophosphate-binding protein [Geomonas terrae]TGU70051.1 thiamine pyrophosphate-binding protein [Geomonas terrae]